MMPGKRFEYIRPSRPSTPQEMSSGGHSGLSANEPVEARVHPARAADRESLVCTTVQLAVNRYVGKTIAKTRAATARSSRLGTCNHPSCARRVMVSVIVRSWQRRYGPPEPGFFP